MNVDSRVFALERFEDQGAKITILINVSSDTVTTDIQLKGVDLLSGKEMDSCMELKPLECLWVLNEED